MGDGEEELTAVADMVSLLLKKDVAGLSFSRPDHPPHVSSDTDSCYIIKIFLSARLAWLEHDLGPAEVACVEMLVGLRRVTQRQLVRNDERRLGLADVDEIAQMTVVGLDVGLTGSDALALEPRETPVEYDLPLLAQLIRASWIIGQENADYADPTGEPHRSHEVVHRHVGVLVALRVMRLLPDALAAFIAPLPIG